MEFFKKIFGLVGKLDEPGLGYEPSPFSKMLAIEKKSDYKPISFLKKYRGNKKVLMICTEQRYMLMENGKKFSSGNHPVEACQPIMHLVNAGFDFDVATPSGKPACIEMWALPSEDKVMLDFFNNVAKPKLDNPKSLESILDNSEELESYVCFFVPGGQGAMLGLPDDQNMDKLLHHIKENDLVLMSVCHGPAALLAAKSTPHPFAGYRIAAFPDSIDKQTPMIGYLPGKQTWYFGEKLIEKNITIVNKGADDTCVVDRKLITGASPKACQELGQKSAEMLLKTYA